MTLSDRVGIFRALRSIPVLLEIAREIERHAPDAVLLNVTNPLTASVQSRDEETSVKTVGLCNELVGLQFWLSLVFDAPMHEVDPVVAGVNHLPLVTALRIGVRGRVRDAREGDARPEPAGGTAGVDGPTRAVPLAASSIRDEVGRRPTSSPTTA